MENGGLSQFGNSVWITIKIGVGGDAYCLELGHTDIDYLGHMAQRPMRRQDGLSLEQFGASWGLSVKIIESIEFSKVERDGSAKGRGREFMLYVRREIYDGLEEGNLPFWGAFAREEHKGY